MRRGATNFGTTTRDKIPSICSETLISTFTYVVASVTMVVTGKRLASPSLKNLQIPITFPSEDSALDCQA